MINFPDPGAACARLPYPHGPAASALFAFAGSLGLACDYRPEHFYPSLLGTIHMVRIRLLLTATERAAPHLEPEASALADAFDRDCVVLRKLPTGIRTFSLYVSSGAGPRRWYEGYLHRHGPAGVSLFYSAQTGTGPAWRFGDGPLEAVPCPPELVR